MESPFNRDDMDELRDKIFGEVKPLLSNSDLIKIHHETTMFCSFTHHMRTASGTYKEIIEKGESIIPDILFFLRDEKMAGMSEIMLLMDITGESPYEPEPIEDTGWGSYSVSDTKQAWINWGKKKGYIK